MKRIIVYVAVLVLLALSPVKRMDIGTLHPVEAVMVCGDKGNVLVKTDTGDWGIGSNVEEALENLKETTCGTVYMDTAEYLLIGEDCEEIVDSFRTVMKGRVRICKAESGVNLQKAAQYLSVHGGLPQLKEWRRGEDLPILTVNEKRLNLLKIKLDKG